MDLSSYKPPTRYKIEGQARTYREKLLTDFLEKINECRAKGGFSNYTYPRLAKLLKGYNEVQLQTLLVDCTCDHIPFTALFFTKVKSRKDVKRKQTL